MKHTLITALFVGALTISVAPAAAKKSDRDPAEVLAEADQNGDGTITWAEVVTMREGLFARIDRNGDGYADDRDRPRGAFGRRYDEKLTELRSRFDVNSDGRISHAEFVDAPSPAFEAGDFDGDNALSPDEMAALRSMRAASNSQ